MPSGIDIPGFGGQLPDGVFVRSISAGTLEQITFRLGLLHALRESGVRVWNDARVIERCVDKSQTTFLLHKNGIPTPRTRVCGNGSARARIHRRARPLAGHEAAVRQPGQRHRAHRRASRNCPKARPSITSITCRTTSRPRDGVFEDWRVLATRHRIVAAMTRRGTTWVTNIHQGGKAQALVPDAEMAAISMAAMRAIDADYAGIDLIRAPNGQLQVLEVNSNPAWRGLQTVADINIAEAIAHDFLRTVLAHRA